MLKSQDFADKVYKMDGSFFSFFSILVFPIIVIYCLAMTYHGVCDLIKLNKRDDEEAIFLKEATKKQTRKYIILALVFTGLAIGPHIAKFTNS
ncbi:MAG: hypothetical protein IKH66_01440 [Campylobacter sp.]|nr:hypothetical protein [Campylobacter sp.]